MLTYKAMYKYVEDGVHAEVLDFPGVISCGKNLQEARRMLASALVDIAETNLLQGEALPQQNLHCTNPEADLEEPIYYSMAVDDEKNMLVKTRPTEETCKANLL